MAVPLTVNGVTFQFPQQGDTNWAPAVTNWAIAVTNGLLQRAGGLFTLLSDVNFGPNFGLGAIYLKSLTPNISTAGVLRLANTDTIDWRNFANTGDLPLGVNTSDQLTFSGAPILQRTGGAGAAGQVLASNGPGVLPSFQTVSGTGTVNPGTTNQVAYYAAAGSTLSGAPSTFITPTGLVVGNGAPDNFGIHVSNGTDVTLGNNVSVALGVSNPAFSTSKIVLSSPNSPASVGIFASTGINVTPTVVALFASAITRITSNGTDVFDFNSNGNISNVDLYVPNGSASIPSLSFNNQSTTGFFLETGNIDLGVTVNGVEVIRATPTNVVIDVPMDMTSHQIHNVAQGTVAGDAINFTQFVDNFATSASGSSTGGTIIASVVLTTVGHPVLILAGGSTTVTAVGGIVDVIFTVTRDGLAITGNSREQTLSGVGATALQILETSIMIMDTPAAGAHTYELRRTVATGTAPTTLETAITALELKA